MWVRSQKPSGICSFVKSSKAFADAAAAHAVANEKLIELIFRANDREHRNDAIPGFDCIQIVQPRFL